MIDIPNYDSWKLSSGLEGEKVYCECSHCDGEIYVGEEYYSIDGEALHEDCLDDYVKDHVAEHMTAVV